jgi:hypothetical protein
MSISLLMDSKEEHQHFVHLPLALLDSIALKTNRNPINPSKEFGKYSAKGFGVVPDRRAAIASPASE